MSPNHARMIQRNARIIQLALVASIGVYALVLYVILQQPPPEPVPPIDDEAATTYWLIIAAATAASIGAGVLIPRQIVSDQRLASAMLGRSPTAPSSNDPLARGMGMAFTGLIMRLAFFEMGALAGLLIGLTTRDFRLFVPGAAIAAVAMLMTRFESERVERVHRQLQDQGALQ